MNWFYSTKYDFSEETKENKETIRLDSEKIPILKEDFVQGSYYLSDAIYNQSPEIEVEPKDT
jgi:hypothetical protein